jgi:hypothetical protein
MNVNDSVMAAAAMMFFSIHVQCKFGNQGMVDG